MAENCLNSYLLVAKLTFVIMTFSFLFVVTSSFQICLWACSKISTDVSMPCLQSFTFPWCFCITTSTVLRFGETYFQTLNRFQHVLFIKQSLPSPTPSIPIPLSHAHMHTRRHTRSHACMHTHTHTHTHTLHENNTYLVSRNTTIKCTSHNWCLKWKIF